MKITQKPKYQPITITLETVEEAEAVWAALESRIKKQDHLNTCMSLADWFCQMAQLSGDSE